MGNRFDEIYQNNEWKHGSGLGSLPQNTTEYVSLLNDLLLRHRIRSVVDMGCGDWQFSRHVAWGEAHYSGWDVAASVIEANRKAFARPGVEFHHYDGNPASLPAADLLIIKDVLQHLPNSEVFKAIAQFGRYRHVLVTNCVAPQGPTVHGGDIAAGEARFLDITAAPFSVPGTKVLTFSRPPRLLSRLLGRPGWKKEVTLVTPA